MSVDQGASATTGPLSPNLSVAGSGVQPSTSGHATSMVQPLSYALADTGNYTGDAESFTSIFPAIAQLPLKRFKMRALANPGPGYVTWDVTVAPDFAGVYAPAPIQPGTVVLAGRWQWVTRR